MSIAQLVSEKVFYSLVRSIIIINNDYDNHHQSMIWLPDKDYCKLSFLPGNKP